MDLHARHSDRRVAATCDIRLDEPGMCRVCLSVQHNTQCNIKDGQLILSRGGSRRWSWRQIKGSAFLVCMDGVPRTWSIIKYTTWKLSPCENERHNLMPLMAFLLQYTHQGRGYFRYVLTVVCEYHLRFLGPYSIMTYSSTFIYQGVLNWFYLFWFNCLLRIFYSSIQQRSPGEKSRQGLWGRSPPEVLNLGHVKTKGIIWCYWRRFLL